MIVIFKENVVVKYDVEDTYFDPYRDGVFVLVKRGGGKVYLNFNNVLSIEEEDNVIGSHGNES